MKIGIDREIIEPALNTRMVLTGKEAHLIKILRKYSYGEIRIFKQNGLLVRLESTESIKLDEAEGLGIDIPHKK